MFRLKPNDIYGNRSGLAACAFLGLSLLATSAQAYWDTDWNERITLTFDNSAQTESFTDFPVLVVLDNTKINYGAVQYLGQDIRFVDADDVTVLAHEIEVWDELGVSYVWVKVPQIDASSDTDFIYLYYDNDTALDGQNQTAVWSSGYAGVWHLGDDPTGGSAIADSGPFSKNGVGSGSMDATNLVTGQVGRGMEFDGLADYILVASDGTDALSITGDNLTLECWIKRNGGPAGTQWTVPLGRQLGTSWEDAYCLILDYNDPTIPGFNTSQGGHAIGSTGELPDLTWKYLVGVQNATHVTVFVDGLQKGQLASGGPVETDAHDLTIAGGQNGTDATVDELFTGTIDEVRISNVPRSDQWIAAQHLSMTGAFIAYNQLIVDTTSDVADAPGFGTPALTIAALTSDPGPDNSISLREAIDACNNTTNGVDPDEIHFNIPGVGPHTIQPTIALPTIDDPVVIDGTTEPDFTTTPVVWLDGVSAGVGVNGLLLANGSGNSTIRGLALVRFDGDGVQIQANADDVTIAGNWIGTDGSGNTAMGNDDDGIEIFGARAVIGGTEASDRNVITNNDDEGINLSGTGAVGATIQGNYIGLEPNGSSGSGNLDVGIAILSGSSGNQVGGTDPGARNVISMNVEGIEINTTGNIIEGNYVGTDVTGLLPRGNHTDDGIEIQSASNNTIGGTEAGAGNLVAFNKRNGVNILSGINNTILGNMIHSNDLLGIDLTNNGVTENDVGDGDSGANNLLNFPEITSATVSGTIVTVNGFFDVPAGIYRLEIFKNPSGADPSGNGEGEILVGASTLVHTGSGPEPFGSAFVGVLGDVITAIVTEDLGGGDYGSSSEFSDAVTVTAQRVISGLIFEDVDFAGTAAEWDGGTGDLALANVEVELYDTSDNYLFGTMTAVDGTFSLTGLGDGTFKVRARSATIGDFDTPPAGGLHPTVPGTWPYPLADMTWGHGIAMIGGQDLTVDDTATGDNAGPGDTWVSVTVSGADVTGVNLGFSYDLITNSDDDSNADTVRSKQGCLRQFIKNSNAIVGVNKSWFQISSP